MSFSDLPESKQMEIYEKLIKQPLKRHAKIAFRMHSFLSDDRHKAGIQFVSLLKIAAEKDYLPIRASLIGSLIRVHYYFGRISDDHLELRRKLFDDAIDHGKRELNWFPELDGAS